jgi:plastocyanin
MAKFLHAWRGAAIALAATLALAGAAQAAEHFVDQRDLMFEPAAMTIKAGDTVRFTDTDRITHNITIVNPDGTTEDKGMTTYSQHIVVQFDKPGVFKVICRIHPNMNMVITVEKP